MSKTHKKTPMRTRNDTNILYSDISYIVQGAVFAIRKEYGPGHKEVVYHRLLIEKLKKEKISVQHEHRINIYSHDTGKIVAFYQPDLLVDNKILMEIKSSRFTTKTDEIQLYHYLRNSEYQLGYLINFSTPRLYMKRIIYSNNRKPWLVVRVN